MGTDLIFDGGWSLRLTVTLLHFVWQGLAIALLAVAAGWCWRARPAARYRVYLSALLWMATCVPLTWLYVGRTQPELPRQASEEKRMMARAATDAAAEPAETGSAPGFSAPADPDHGEGQEGQALRAQQRQGDSVLPIGQRRPLSRVAHYAAVAYVVGVLLMLVRLLRAAWEARRLRCTSIPVNDTRLLAMIGRQSRRLRLRAAPPLAWCTAVAVPVVVGVARPIVLLPASLATGLAPDQLEPLLVHELAHIRRYDLVFNLLQRLIEAVLFFHPAVWYISRRVSVERENACDDLVVSAGWPQVHYAGALVQMAQLARRPGIAAGGPAGGATLLAASGERPSQLKRRVLRLLGHEPPPQSQLVPGSIALILATAALVLAPMLLPGWAQTGPGTGTTREAAEAPAADGRAVEARSGAREGREPALAGVAVLEDGQSLAAGVEILVSRRNGEVLQRLQTDEEGRFALQRQWWEPADIEQNPRPLDEPLLLLRDAEGRSGWRQLRHPLVAQMARDHGEGPTYAAIGFEAGVSTLRIVLLESNRKVSGRIVTPRGKSLPNVRVLAAELRHPANGSLALPAPLAGQEEPLPWPSAVTDAEGRFEFGLPASAARELLIVHRDWVSLAVPLDQRDDLGVIELAPGGSIKGRIVQGPGEDPMSGVVVRVLASSPTAGGAGVGGRAISDAHGRYVVGGLPPGEYGVNFDVLAGVRLVPVAAGRVSDANIVVPPGRAVIGRVIDAQSGQPVPFVRVAVMPSIVNEVTFGYPRVSVRMHPWVWPSMGLNRVSDNEGRFQVQIPPGRYRFRAESRSSSLGSYPNSERTIDVDPGDEPVEVVLEVNPPHKPPPRSPLETLDEGMRASEALHSWEVML